jgi:hypothetical protein
MRLEEACGHVGFGVVYSPGHYHERWTGMGLLSSPALGRKVNGVITSVNDTYVFVRYAGDQHSKATAPKDLELLTPEIA